MLTDPVMREAWIRERFEQREPWNPTVERESFRMTRITDLPWILEDISILCSASICPPIPARGPTYSCGGEPPESGYAEDAIVELIHPEDATKRLDITKWLTETELENIEEAIYAEWEQEQL
jgi:hypothetical protein